jgi:hypothetical protein
VTPPARPRIRWALLLGLLAALAFTSTARADPSICVYFEDRAAIPPRTGHSFVQLLPDSGPDAGKKDLIYGFHPTNDWAFLDSKGKVVKEPSHGWTWKICYPVSPTNYNKAQSAVRADIARPPNYKLLYYNCTDWSYKVGRAAGLKLPTPSLGGDYRGVFDPDFVAKQLDILYRSGHTTFNGGTITKNTRRSALAGSTGAGENGSEDGPGDFRELNGTESVLYLVDLAFSRPAALAEGLDLSSERETLRDVRLAPGGELRVAVDGAPDKASLTGVRFGDDGADAFQRDRFTHTYREPGVYRARGFGVANEMVYRFQFDVEVTEGAGGADVRTTVPEGRAHPDGEPSYEAPDPPAPVPVP